MSVPEQKSELRQEIERLRSELPADLHREYSREACRLALDLLAAQGALRGQTPTTGRTGPECSAAFVYFPFGSELDISPLIEKLWASGVPVAAPVSLRRPKRLEWRLTTGYDDLQPGVWGIREPKPSCPLLTDPGERPVILVPGVAFDPDGWRLGYGGGYYDRFLSELQSAGRTPLMLALAFELQVVPRVPRERHDIRMDALVTEGRSIVFGEEKTT